MHLEHDAVRIDALDTLLLDARVELLDLVGVMAASPAVLGERHDGRHLLPADIGSELAAVDEHACRKRGTDLREATWDRGEQLLVLTDDVSRARASQPHG